MSNVKQLARSERGIAKAMSKAAGSTNRRRQKNQNGKQKKKKTNQRQQIVRLQAKVNRQNAQLARDARSFRTRQTQVAARGTAYAAGLRSNIGRSMSDRGLKFSTLIGTYLDTVINPFGCKNVTRKPDCKTTSTVVLKDYYYTSSPLSASAFNNTALDATVLGFFIMFNWGWNQFYGNGITNQQIYNIYLWAVNADGTLAGNVNGGPICLSTQNYATIYDTFANSLRPIAAGLRLLPQIEINTNSQTTAVKTYYGGQMSVDMVDDIIVGNGQIKTPVQNDPVMDEYGNAQGCTVRLNPCADKLEDILTYSNWAQAANNTSAVMMPYIFVETNQSITPVDNQDGTSTITWPVFLDFTLYVEAVPDVPSPLFATPSPFCPQWQQFCELAKAGSTAGVLPLVSEGHSFKSMSQKASSFLNWANKTVRFGQAVMPLVQTAHDTYKKIYK